jgi:hypothetical protein
MTSTLDKKQLAILVFAVFPLITSSGGRSPKERGTLFTTPGATIYYEVTANYGRGLLVRFTEYFEGARLIVMELVGDYFPPRARRIAAQPALS